MVELPPVNSSENTTYPVMNPSSPPPLSSTTTMSKRSHHKKKKQKFSRTKKIISSNESPPPLLLTNTAEVPISSGTDMPAVVNTIPVNPRKPKEDLDKQQNTEQYLKMGSAYYSVLMQILAMSGLGETVSGLQESMDPELYRKKNLEALLKRVDVESKRKP
jgi:hypothetical protein